MPRVTEGRPYHDTRPYVAGECRAEDEAQHFPRRSPMYCGQHADGMYRVCTRYRGHTGVHVSVGSFIGNPFSGQPGRGGTIQGRWYD